MLWRWEDDKKVECCFIYEKKNNELTEKMSWYLSLSIIIVLAHMHNENVSNYKRESEMIYFFIILGKHKRFNLNQEIIIMKVEWEAISFGLILA